MSLTYTATLDVGDRTVYFLSGLLAQNRRDLGTRSGRRALPTLNQAILVLRWFLNGSRVRQLARDNNISKSTAYDYLHEGISVLAKRAPCLKSALLAAKTAGYAYIIIDGTIIEIDRCRTAGPTPGADLWWSGKIHNHGGNIQVITAPDGWPIWTSDVRPGREHDTTAVRAHKEILPLLQEVRECLRTLADLGYQGAGDGVIVAYKKPKNGELTDIQQQFNIAHNGRRAVGERGNSVLKMTFKALRNVSLCPRIIGDIVAAALVLLHFEHDRTT
jgi:hypothetical protein